MAGQNPTVIISPQSPPPPPPILRSFLPYSESLLNACSNEATPLLPLNAT